MEKLSVGILCAVRCAKTEILHPVWGKRCPFYPACSPLFSFSRRKLKFVIYYRCCGYYGVSPLIFAMVSRYLSCSIYLYLLNFASRSTSSGSCTHFGFAIKLNKFNETLPEAFFELVICTIRTDPWTCIPATKMAKRKREKIAKILVSHRGKMQWQTQTVIVMRQSNLIFLLILCICSCKHRTTSKFCWKSWISNRADCIDARYPQKHQISLPWKAKDEWKLFVSYLSDNIIIIIIVIRAHLIASRVMHAMRHGVHHDERACTELYARSVRVQIKNIFSQ